MRRLMVGGVCVMALVAMVARGEKKIDVDGVMRVAARKLAAFDASRSGDYSGLPTDAKGDEWRTVPSRDWTSGFYPGALWYMYEYARDEGWSDADVWLKRADAWTMALEKEQHNTGTHDLGFMIFDSFGNGYRLTKNPAYLPIINQAAQSLAQRFRPETRMIRSWGKIDDMKSYRVIIDNMMNLELLIWSAANGGTTKGGSSEQLREIALTHANRTLELFFRPDSTTYHVINLRAGDGSVEHKGTRQGMSDDSCWSRGQAWAIYGFSYMYEATGDERYLQQAVKSAEYFLTNLADDGVAPSDFDSDLHGREFRDSSASAIVASACFRLHRIAKEPAVKERFLKAGIEKLRVLTTPPYYCEGDDFASLLRYGSRDYNTDAAHRLTNTSLIWGDYYLLEALMQYKRVAR